MLYCIVLVSLGYTGCKNAGSTSVKATDTSVNHPPASVLVHPPLQVTAIGEVIGYNTVVVKSRVDGPILQIAFREGQNVKQGDLLAVIDPATFRIALEQASASRDKELAELNQAKATFARNKALYEEGIIAKQEFEKQEATFHQLEGSVRADQASVDRAALDMGYTKILAPVGGRVGFRTIDAGNIVHPNDPAGIVTITQIQPIIVIFSVSPDRLNQIVKFMHKRQVPVEAFSENGKNLLGRGKVLAVDSAIDSTTGFAKIKAFFPNTNQSLWPNEFVQIKLQLDDAG